MQGIYAEDIIVINHDERAYQNRDTRIDAVIGLLSIFVRLATAPECYNFSLISSQILFSLLILLIPCLSELLYQLRVIFSLFLKSFQHCINIIEHIYKENDGKGKKKK